MHTPFTMSTQKSLQMVLTTLLLVLAILAMNWQEKIGQQNPAASHNLGSEKMPAGASMYTDCCLYHAVRAAEGGGIYTGDAHSENKRQVFNVNTMLISLDSANHLAAGNYY